MPLFPNLDDLDEHVFTTNERKLETFRPIFFSPRMADCPQNPIMDGLKHGRTDTDIPSTLPLPDQFALITTDNSNAHSELHDTQDLSKWHISTEKQSELVTWDSLHSMHPSKPSHGCLVSEQIPSVFASVMYHVMPPIHDDRTEPLRVTQSIILKSLKMTSLGLSSILYSWDSLQQKFVIAHVAPGITADLFIDEKDNVLSSSIVSTFLRIGTLLRRLDIYLADIKMRCSRDGSTIHAFIYSLSSILTLIRHRISTILDDGHDVDDVSMIWLLEQYSEPETMLVALSEFYHREESKTPDQYTVIDMSPPFLLSRIYRYVEIHIDRQSSCKIVGLFAFMLTVTSHHYLQKISTLVGYRSDATFGPGQDANGSADENGGDKKTEADELMQSFPVFFSPELVETLPAAQKSLVLLRAVQPAHPLLVPSVLHAPICWLWTHSEITDAYVERPISKKTVTLSLLPKETSTRSFFYKPELAEFRVFDQEPGSHFNISIEHPSDVTRFLESFPVSLPLIVPTLSQLSHLIFKPLLCHAAAVSSALLSMLLSPSVSLNLLRQMELLRSFLLLTSPSFRSRLEVALFSDLLSSREEDRSYHRWSLQNLRRERGNSTPSRPWPVGLARALVDGDTWPPVGADLSFLLRTVIIDSIESKVPAESDITDREELLEEAERRLGFAIRDLPGQDKWLNPSSIEALDFLYMDYKPPHPLEVVITPSVLSQYHRMFTLLLRLLRAKNAMNGLFRIARSHQRPLFPTLVASNRLFLHFRFAVHSFMTTLCAYIFDTAIGGNFDAFLVKFSTKDNQPLPFSDVFSLSRAHHLLLNDILSACLLRTSQRAAGDLLYDLLQLILDFVSCMCELSQGSVEEYQAAPVLEDLYDRFKRTATALVRAIKSFAKNMASGQQLAYLISELDAKEDRKPPGGTDALLHLALRLDIGDWFDK